MRTYRKLKILAFFLTIPLLFSTCTNKDGQAENRVSISAAISLRDAVEEIGAVFREKFAIEPEYNFASSGVLQQQIEAGAPVDIFLSAGERQIDALERSGSIETESRRDFAGNSLVLIIPANSTIAISDMKDLQDSRVERIAIGNPKTVPAGVYAAESIRNLGIETETGKKLIYAENVRQVLDYVVRGEVDAGIVYSSDVETAGNRVKIAARVEPRTHSPIRYPLAIVKTSNRKEAARAFARFLLSAEAQQILKKHGFTSVPEQ
ncbi:MAG: molybdate ABC transporter substrate-binding protein [Pyrinomonadaceae bacterium]|nr:molybdate ABC transporter substrate-binding protein [Pyrinomonadaceae bacterium]